MTECNLPNWSAVVAVMADPWPWILLVGLCLAGLCLVALLTALLERAERRTGDPQHELMLLRLGEARGRQQVLDDVRMLEHGQLKTHVLAVQRCLALARAASSAEQRAGWLDEGLSQAGRLLDVVVMLHQSAGASALPSDLEQTVADVAHSLAVAYPRCACHVEVAGRRPAQIDDSIKRALTLVLYNALTNAYLHGRPARVAVQLQYAPDALILIVRDDGRGLAPAARRSGGRGLRDMRALVDAHGGTLRIVSEPASGTQLRVTFPLAGTAAATRGEQDATYPLRAAVGG